jgi:hypothetical protein
MCGSRIDPLADLVPQGIYRSADIRGPKPQNTRGCGLSADPKFSTGNILPLAYIDLDSELIKQLKPRLADALKLKFALSTIHHLALFLHPQYKALRKLSADDARSCRPNHWIPSPTSIQSITAKAKLSTSSSAWLSELYGLNYPAA